MLFRSHYYCTALSSRSCYNTNERNAISAIRHQVARQFTARHFSICQPNHHKRFSKSSSFSSSLLLSSQVALLSTTSKTPTPPSILSVAIVYGSFTPQEQAHRDAWEIYDVLNGANVMLSSTETGVEETKARLSVSEPLDGSSFSIDTLSQTDVLVLSTSSCLGLPPKNLMTFCHELVLAGSTNPNCLHSLSHAVWGCGDIRWHNTYMNVPRYLDLLLGEQHQHKPIEFMDYVSDNKTKTEKPLPYCGSQRIYPRGERGEPHLDDRECSSAAMWASKMISGATWPHPTTGNSTATNTVEWDALWNTHNTLHHCNVQGFTIEDIITTHGVDGLDKLSQFARPDDEYRQLMDRYIKLEQRYKENKTEIITKQNKLRRKKRQVIQQEPSTIEQVRRSQRPMVMQDHHLESKFKE